MKVSYPSLPWNYDDIGLLKDVLKHADTSPSATSWSPVPPQVVVDVEGSQPSSLSLSSSSSSSSEQSNEQIIPVYHKVSASYSGPTLVDIEKALSVTTPTSVIPSNQLSHSRISLLERELNKPDNKYTLKINSSSGMADDGYKWRKYGQKIIKNSPNPRSYYKCTNPRCGAKKQVERSMEDPDTLIITYEGLHLHFAYPYFSNTQTEQVNPPLKKAKKTLIVCNQDDEMQKEIGNQEIGYNKSEAMQSLKSDDTQQQGTQGLLEDMVPLAVRNPFSEPMFDVSSSCSSLYPSSLVSTTPLNNLPNCFPLLWDSSCL